MIKIVFFLHMILYAPVAAVAAEFAVMAGAHSSDVDSKIGESTGGKSGGHIGFLGFAPLAGESYLRSGAILSRHRFEVGTGNTELKPSYIEVPVSYMYLANDAVGIFAGPRVALNLGDGCDADGSDRCQAENFENLLWSVEAGGQFRFTPNVGAELAYVHGISTVSASTENLTSLMISGLFLF